jgi:hypothetical protein
MKKILYLHGLETPQGGEKVDFLTKNAIVHAPELDYKNPNIFHRLLYIMVNTQPDVVIGSSIGGYVGFVLGGLYDKQVIAFNPAFHNRKIDVDLGGIEIEDLKFSSLPIFVFGEEDKVINPIKSMEILKQNNIRALIESYGGGHRVPFQEFTDIYNKYLNG